jgi:glycosyltransferase involved in cell wall biosynthesis
VRVLFAVHTPVDPRLGGPGASIAVARELGLIGHEVEFFGYDHAFPGVTEFSARHQVVFPWKLARFLIRSATRFDVLDITTGDSYIWARLGRRGAAPDLVLVTRSNGIEHQAHAARLAEAAKGRLDLSWRYPIYHGGLRLWEVAQSIRAADAVLVPTENERRFVVDRLRANEATTRVVPHGIDPNLLRLPTGTERKAPQSRSARLCFLGNWFDQKGISDVVETVEALTMRGTPFKLLIAGTGRRPEDVVAAFPTDARARLRVVERYRRHQLAELLSDQEILLFPSRYEGFGLALLEAMACGVVPITTPVGVAGSIVRDGENGIIVEPGRIAEIVAAVERLTSSRAFLSDMSARATETARSFTWQKTAEATLALYELARRRRIAASS